MPDGFLNSQDFNYDYAYITYPGNSNTGFGWQGFIDHAAMIAAGTTLHSCGYPARFDTCLAWCRLRPFPPQDPEQYCAQGTLDSVDDHDIYAHIDSDEGQSGGPLYEQRGNDYIAYGMVSDASPGCPRGLQYERLTAEKLYEMFSRMGGVEMDFRIRAQDSNVVYIHIMDGSALNTATRIGGRVYADYINGNNDDAFKVFPVYQSSSKLCTQFTAGGYSICQSK